LAQEFFLAERKKSFCKYKKEKITNLCQEKNCLVTRSGKKFLASEIISVRVFGLREWNNAAKIQITKMKNNKNIETCKNTKKNEPILLRRFL